MPLKQGALHRVLLGVGFIGTCHIWSSAGAQVASCEPEAKGRQRGVKVHRESGHGRTGKRGRAAPDVGVVPASPCGGSKDLVKGQEEAEH